VCNNAFGDRKCLIQHTRIHRGECL
jgi:hypothetical protein